MTKWPLWALAAAIIATPLIYGAGALNVTTPAAAQTPGAQSFTIATSGQTPIMAWRINQTTGAVSMCYSSDQNSAPRCTAWSSE
jgi:hypothetical protein